MMNLPTFGNINQAKPQLKQHFDRTQTRRTKLNEGKERNGDAAMFNTVHPCPTCHSPALGAARTFLRLLNKLILNSVPTTQ